jgi:hypothetical protein
MRTNWTIVSTLLLAFSLPIQAADPPLPTPPIDQLAAIAQNPKANLSERLIAIDSIGSFGATATYAPAVIMALHPLLAIPAQTNTTPPSTTTSTTTTSTVTTSTSTTTTTKTETLTPSPTSVPQIPPESFQIWLHVVQALPISGAYAVTELPAMATLKGRDPFLDAAIVAAAALIQQAKQKADAAPPVATQPQNGSQGPATPIAAIAKFSALCDQVGKAAKPEDVVTACVNVFQDTSATPELVRFAGSIGKVVAAATTAPTNLSSYLTALAKLLSNATDAETAVWVAGDLGDLGTQDSLSALSDALTKPKQDPAVILAASEAIAKINTRYPKNPSAAGGADQKTK